MSGAAKEIAEQKMKAYAKIHIPVKEEMMDDIMAIGKAIADSQNMPKPADDVIAVFVENNNHDLEFYGFAGDSTGAIDTEGNLIHIGDTVEMTLRGWYLYRQYALNILPKQKAIDHYNAKVIKPYTEFSGECCKSPNGIFHAVSCLNEYLKSINQPDTQQR